MYIQLQGNKLTGIFSMTGQFWKKSYTSCTCVSFVNGGCMAVSYTLSNNWQTIRTRDSWLTVDWQLYMLSFRPQYFLTDKYNYNRGVKYLNYLLIKCFKF